MNNKTSKKGGVLCSLRTILIQCKAMDETWEKVYQETLPFFANEIS